MLTVRFPRKPMITLLLLLADVPNVLFSKRYRCEWGTWGIVAASQATSELMLASFPDVRHVYLASGSCLPLRPVHELIDYLADRPRTDFIESATTADVPWTVGGWTKNGSPCTSRFRGSATATCSIKPSVSNDLKLKRRMPHGLVPHMGSQWWCLTRQTLSAILQDPERPKYDRYFRHVWIPDESYFQTLVAALFDKCRKPFADAVQVRLSG